MQPLTPTCRSESFTDASYRINADGIVGKTGDLLGHNLFAYCKNNPVNMEDSDGKFAWFVAVPIIILITQWIITTVTAPDFEHDLNAVTEDIADGDNKALAVDILCAAVPVLTAGGGRFSKAVKKVSKPSKKSVIKKAQLPTTGKIRYVPPKSWSSSEYLPKKGQGYLEGFGNSWVNGSSRTAGDNFEWDVQLSRTGKSQLGQFTRDGSHLNVSLDGKITHK